MVIGSGLLFGADGGGAAGGETEAWQRPFTFELTMAHTATASSGHAGHGAGAHGGAHGGAHKGPHIVSFQLLFVIFAILMVLTFATVAATWIDLGYTGNLILAMAIAVVKAALVMLYFMHLRWDTPFNAMLAVGSLLFIAIFIVTCITDTGQYQNNVASFKNAQPVGSGALPPR